MRFLVTGGAGFIGSHLVEYLAGEGHEVVVLDDFSTGKRENLDGVHSKIEIIEGTITDLATCTRACRGVDFVFHEAALASVPRSLRDPLATHHVNTTGTLNVLLAARDTGVRRVVYAASSSAYGNTAELPKHETMVAKPLSPYAVSKLTGEQYCRACTASFGVETVALRYFNIFGARQDPNSQYAAVVPKFITAAQASESPVIFGDGEQTRDFTFVANAVRANMLACIAPAQGCCGEVFNVGCGTRISVNELWRRIAALLECDAHPQYVPARSGDVRDSLASLERSHRALGYSPAVSIADGLRRTVEWYTLRKALADASNRSVVAPADERDQERLPNAQQVAV
ncbi:MAG TPA: SDR family oxidoreductase [Gemmatimonadaceae bacterium]|nr:SDR family oxidoreductase [Gemmatimonadaceae bacterium]